MPETFDATLCFRWVRGPFPVRVTVDDEFIEVSPKGPRILRTIRAFQPVRVPHSDVSHIEGDSASTWGLRVRTTSGVLDTRLVIPDTPRQRDELRRAFEAHGYVVR